MRQPGVDRPCPLAQVELWKEWLVHRFQGCQDVAHFFAGMTSNATEGFQFVEATAELEKGSDQADRASPSRESWCHVQPQPNTTQADDRTVSAPGPSLP
jgi:hypothetical protein